MNSLLHPELINDQQTFIDNSLYTIEQNNSNIILPEQNRKNIIYTYSQSKLRTAKGRYRNKLLSLIRKRESEFHASSNSNRYENDYYELKCTKYYRKILWEENVRTKQRYRLSKEEFDYKYSSQLFVNQALDFMSLFAGKTTNADCMDLLEDLSLLIYHLYSAHSKTDLLMAGAMYLKLRLKSSLAIKISKTRLSSYISRMLKDNFSLQANDMYAEDEHPKLANMRELLDNWPKLKQSAVYRKIRRVMAFVVSLTMWEDKGDNGEVLLQVEHEEYTSKAAYASEFAYSIADFLLFLLERGYQCCKTGSFQPIFHSGASYEAWYNKALDLIANATYLDNPTAFKLDIHQYTAEVNKSIKQGECIYKYAAQIDKQAKKVVSSTLFKLKVIAADRINQKSLNTIRRAPFSVLISGHSSVAKTTFANIVHVYFSSLTGKNKGMEYKYTRTKGSEYWEGYTSEKHTIVFDDIAFENPATGDQRPAWIDDTIDVINNTPIALNMAAVDSKGKVPCMAELCIGTTNSPNLFANHYASCPLAILRRWALHVHIRPKKEYMRGETMIDTSKLERAEEGQFPDYWEIEIFKIKTGEPKTTNEEDKYRLNAHTISTEIVFRRMEDFLVYLGHKISEHKKVQDKVILGDQAMLNVEICKYCMKYNNCDCEPTLELQASETVETWFATIRGFFTGMFCLKALDMFFGLIFIKYMGIPLDFVTGFRAWFFVTMTGMVQIVNFFHQYFVDRYMDYVRPVQNSMMYPFRYFAQVFESHGAVTLARAIEKMIYLGDVVFARFSVPVMIMTFCAILSMMLAAWWSRGLGKMDLEGNVMEIGSPPSGEGGEAENSWVKPDYHVTDFDFNRKILSWKGLSREKVDKAIAQNTVYLKWHKNARDRTGANAICLAGQWYLAANHTVPTNQCGVDYKRHSQDNIHCKIGDEDIIRYPDRDLCLVRIRGVPIKRSIMSLFAPDKYHHNGPSSMRTRQVDGDIKSYSCKRSFSRTQANEHLNISQEMYISKIPETYNGMCGSPLYAHTDMGPIILGIHEMGGNQNIAAAIRVTSEDIRRMFKDIPVIEPSVPDLHTETLKPVHHKSEINFVNQAQIDVHGSLDKFRQSPSSGVARTLACELMIRDGYTLKHGKPIMSGWRPWHRAFKEIINGDNSMDENIIAECRESILYKWEQIPHDQRRLEILDIKSCVNGKPGYKFVDKINRSTSAGFPWRKSKKYLYTSLPSDEEYDQPIEFDKEVIDLVQKRYDLYMNNQSSHPIFIASPKDEPLKFAKIKIFKTRYFYGGPVDFTIIVRMALLSFLRLSMNNPLIFEASPGINAHGKDWSDLYQYLTQFGKHRMIFGDFADYDITMRAPLILHAFQIIEEYHRRSGCSEEHLKLIRGIAYDIAFPLVDFNGTLVTFFGKNPSGQPLTVVINGLVNCIYMRYCYRTLNPASEVMSFNQNVALTTYGDDNGQGVTDKIDWYNHTAISKILAIHNVTYTMAVKTAESVPFIDISEADFLKRRWRFDESLQEFMAPLEMESIIKSLMIGVKSKAITAEQHITEVFHSAMLEFAHHGEIVYNEWLNRLSYYILQLDLLDYFEDRPLLSFEQILDVYFRKNLSLQSSETRDCLCEKSTCTLDKDEDIRICAFCKHCRFDDWDLDCPNCGFDDICYKCYQPSLDLFSTEGYIYSKCSLCKDTVISWV